jgi:shikimate kinase
MTRHLVLIGMMGAGKTSVGAVCACRLDRPFVDTDDLVEAMTGRTVAQLFADPGEERFREVEAAAVADACATPTPAVIACGGGAVLEAESRRRMRADGFVVWLQGSPPVLRGRVEATAPDRPLLAPGALVTLERLAGARAVAYEAAADASVDTDHRTIEEVADAVLEVYEP